MIKRQYPEDPEAAVDVDVDVDGEGEPDYTETWNSASPPPPKRLRAATKDDKKPATTKSAPKAKVKKESAASAPGKRSGTWSSDELMRLYEQMCPKRVSRGWHQCISTSVHQYQQQCYGRQS
jgi:hypothetical protein